MASSGNNFNLELVQVLFRHGARTNSKSEIESALPNYVDQSLHETYGYEQLTNVGKAQAYNLGLVLRDRYNEFLGSPYKSQDVHAQSSDTDRTKMSLQLVLAGLYPPTPEEVWNDNLMWQPIPICYTPAPADFLLRAFDKRKFLTFAASLITYTEAEQEELNALNKFFKSKGVNTIETHGYYGAAGIFNILKCHTTSNGKLPDWCTNELLEKLKKVTQHFIYKKASTPELCKRQIGPLVKQCLYNLNLTKKCANGKKIYLYSGHDFNVSAFLNAHGIRDTWYLEFSSAVILETFRDSKNQQYVRMVGWTGKDFVKLTLGNHGEYCPIEEYIKFIKDNIPTIEEINSMRDDDGNQ